MFYCRGRPTLPPVSSANTWLPWLVNFQQTMKTILMSSWAPESDRQSGNPSRLTWLLLIFSYRRAKLTISSIFSNKPWLPPTHFSHLALSHNIILFRIKILSLGYYFVSLIYIVCLKLEMFFISLFLFTKYYSITARSRSECIEIVIPFMLIFIEIE